MIRSVLVLSDLDEYNYHNYFSYYSSIVFRMRQYKYRKQFKKLYVNIGQYFRQWNAWTHQGTISHELLSTDNFATFHQIYSNICLKYSRYVSHYHKAWSGEFRNKGTAKFAKNRRFRNRVYSLLPSCSAILDFSCWPHFRYVCVSNLSRISMWSVVCTSLITILVQI